MKDPKQKGIRLRPKREMFVFPSEGVFRWSSYLNTTPIEPQRIVAVRGWSRQEKEKFDFRFRTGN